MRRTLVSHAALLFLLSVGCGESAPDADAGSADAGGADATAGCTTDSQCDDGLFCNGDETCAAGACVAGQAPCIAGQSCNESGGCITDCADPDADGDGFDAEECGGRDCDDADGDRFPGNVERCDVDDHDEDCDASTFGFRDGDMDGFPDAECCNIGVDGPICGSDCDDQLGVVHPTEAESCDTLDNDCDGEIDEGVGGDYWPDLDGDSFGDASATPMHACSQPPMSAPNDGDCDDDEPTRNPSAPDVCDLVFDNDCNPATNPFDLDRDGHDDADCGGDDCNDDVATVYPGNAEVCDRRDSDCSEGGVVLPEEDIDRDRHAPIGASCVGGYPADDCDDDEESVYPGNVEHCNGRDDDCDPGTPDPADCAQPSVVRAVVLATSTVDQDGAADVSMQGVDVDSADNIYVTGSFRSDTGDVRFGDTVVPSQAGSARVAFVASYTPVGDLRWVHSMPVRSSGLAIRAVGGEVAIVGEYSEDTMFGAFSLVHSNGAEPQPFVAHLAAATGSITSAVALRADGGVSVAQVMIGAAGDAWISAYKETSGAGPVFVGDVSVASPSRAFALRVALDGSARLYDGDSRGAAMAQSADHRTYLLRDASDQNAGVYGLTLSQVAADGTPMAPTTITTTATGRFTGPPGWVAGEGDRIWMTSFNHSASVGGTLYPFGFGSRLFAGLRAGSFEWAADLELLPDRVELWGEHLLAVDGGAGDRYGLEFDGDVIFAFDRDDGSLDWAFDFAALAPLLGGATAIRPDGAVLHVARGDQFRRLPAPPNGPRLTAGALVDEPALAYYVRLQ